MSNSSAPSVGYDTYAHHGRNIIREFHEKLKKDMGQTPVIPARLRASPIHPSAKDAGVSPIGILGAGEWFSTTP